MTYAETGQQDVSFSEAEVDPIRKCFHNTIIAQIIIVDSKHSLLIGILFMSRIDKFFNFIYSLLDSI